MSHFLPSWPPEPSCSYTDSVLSSSTVFLLLTFFLGERERTTYLDPFLPVGRSGGPLMPPKGHLRAPVSSTPVPPPKTDARENGTCRVRRKRGDGSASRSVLLEKKG